MKAILQDGIAFCDGLVFGALVIQLGHLAGQPLHFTLHLVQLVENGEAFVKHGAARELQPFLRQIADADAARLVEGSVVQRLETGENLHQRGFAGAVGAHQRSFFVVADKPVGFKEKNSRSEAFTGIFKSKHEILFSQRQTALRSNGAVFRADHRRAIL